MKRLFFITFSALLFLTFAEFDVKAANEDIPKTVDGRKMSIKEIEELLNSPTEHTIELTNQQVAELYALKKDISLEEANKEIIQYSKGYTQYSTSSCSWFGTNTSVSIPGKSYRPNLIVYIELCRGGAQYINTNKKPLLQEFQANPISFNGTISVELFNGHFYYIVNGNFYKSTTTTHTGTSGINSLFSATYSVGSTSNYYASLTTSRTKRDVLGY